MDKRQYSVSQKPFDAGVNSRSGTQHTPLMMAAEAGRTATVALLLQRGASVNLRNRKGKTALYYANIYRYNDRFGNVTTILKKSGGVL